MPPTSQYLRTETRNVEAAGGEVPTGITASWIVPARVAAARETTRRWGRRRQVAHSRIYPFPGRLGAVDARSAIRLPQRASKHLPPGTGVVRFRNPTAKHLRSNLVTELSELRARASSCQDCRLASGRTTVVFGEGSPSATLMVIGEGPGRDEDLQGRPFVGRSGRLLDRLLAEEAGLERDAVYIANVVKCRPPENRDPKPDEIEACRPYLDAQVALISPKVVITLGNFASKTLLRSELGITRLRGRVYPWPSGEDTSGDPSGLGSTVVVPTFHPAAALRGGGEVLAAMRADFVRARRSLEGVPASGVSPL